MKDKLIAHNGSVQHIEEIPDDLKELYKTVWEMSGKNLVEMAVERGAFIDQSQSFSVVCIYIFGMYLCCLSKLKNK